MESSGPPLEEGHRDFFFIGTEISGIDASQAVWFIKKIFLITPTVKWNYVNSYYEIDIYVGAYCLYDNFPTKLMNVFPASSCPMRDLSCVASDGTNVITTTTTSDDAECGGKFSMYLFLET